MVEPAAPRWRWESDDWVTLGPLSSIVVNVRRSRTPSGCRHVGNGVDADLKRYAVPGREEAKQPDATPIEDQLRIPVGCVGP
jgi:hypothetical protein